MTASVFVQACEDLFKKLEGDPERAALVLRARLIHLIEVFRRFETEQPSASERADGLNQLIDLNRSALIYVSKKTRPR